MFGPGIYFADMASKSANYCRTDADNSIWNFVALQGGTR